MNNQSETLSKLFSEIPSFYRLDILKNLQELQPNYLQDVVFHAMHTALHLDDIPAAKAIGEIYAYINETGLAEILGLQDRLDTVNFGTVSAAKGNLPKDFEFTSQPDTELIKDFEIIPLGGFDLLGKLGELGQKDYIDPNAVFQPFTMLSEDIKQELVKSVTTNQELLDSTEESNEEYEGDLYYHITAVNHFTVSDINYGRLCVMRCFEDIPITTTLSTRQMNRKMLTVAANSNYTELGKRGLNLMYVCRKQLAKEGILRRVYEQEFRITAKGEELLNKINRFNDGLPVRS